MASLQLSSGRAGRLSVMQIDAGKASARNRSGRSPSTQFNRSDQAGCDGEKSPKSNGCVPTSRLSGMYADAHLVARS